MTLAGWIARVRKRWRVRSERLDRRLRTDPDSNARRIERLGERRLDRLVLCGVVATVIVQVAVPLRQLAGPGPWGRVWTIVAAGAGVLLVALFSFFYRAGR